MCVLFVSLLGLNWATKRRRRGACSVVFTRSQTHRLVSIVTSQYGHKLIGSGERQSSCGLSSAPREPSFNIRTIYISVQAEKLELLCYHNAFAAETDGRRNYVSFLMLPDLIKLRHTQRILRSIRRSH